MNKKMDCEKHKSFGIRFNQKTKSLYCNICRMNRVKFNLVERVEVSK